MFKSASALAMKSSAVPAVDIIDNGATEHAKRAISGVRKVSASTPDQNNFYTRVRNGYSLNELRVGTITIRVFDIDSELTCTLARKSVARKDVQSNYCRVG
ncbi:hypothetical protein ACO0LF_31065 [Undibacterium sp. Di27W]|uniref:hypothetical protein n=1 Tax=Undibacterium sp. Di27W TaxID=3413036 RepID=UPI003BF31086